MNIFEKAVSVDGIEQGIWKQPDLPGDEIIPFTNEIGGETLPVRLRIRSKASTAYREQESGRTRENVSTMVGQRNSKRGNAKLVSNTTKDRRAEDFSVLVSGFENVEAKGVTTPSRADLLNYCADYTKEKGWIVRSGMIWLVDWALSIADDDDEYGAEAGKSEPASE